MYSKGALTNAENYAHQRKRTR